MLSTPYREDNCDEVRYSVRGLCDVSRDLVICLVDEGSYGDTHVIVRGGVPTTWRAMIRGAKRTGMQIELTSHQSNVAVTGPQKLESQIWWIVSLTKAIEVDKRW